MKLRAFLSLVLVFCILLLPALGQTKPAAPPQPQKPIDDKDEVVKITTNLVQVDAVVTKDGKPVVWFAYRRSWSPATITCRSWLEKRYKKQDGAAGPMGSLRDREITNGRGK
jgi:hypothetical protein